MTDPVATISAHEANQRRAADPDHSAWVAANAGAGKTSVLVNRVTRLLLQGAAPWRILCLTFTKAAAAEMALRLSERLGKWATLSDEKLAGELSALLGRDPSPIEREQARQLFARTLESPGGLRLQTIHAFCEALLKRFPLEAEIPPHFSVADDARAAELLEQAQTQVLRSSADDPDLAAALLFMAENLDDASLMRLQEVLVARRRLLAQALAVHGSAEGVLGALAAVLNLAPGHTAERVIAAYTTTMPLADLRAAAAAMAEGSTTDRTQSARMLAWLDTGCPAERIEQDWLPVFLTQKSTPRDRPCTVGMEKKRPGTSALLQAEQSRLIRLQEDLKGLALLASTGAALRIGEKILTFYTDLKKAQGLLDYDDLILKSSDLLAEPMRVPWVMYKLDAGIEHVLVDEAQDTSPDQWDVIRRLAAEFFDGQGAQEKSRTVFAVGDVKQSIYSFQGARPQAFFDMRDHFRAKAQGARKVFEALPLAMSFRSSPAVLELVDAVFANEVARTGLVEPGEMLQHPPRRSGEPGLVEFWPPLAPGARADPANWDVPLDYVHEDDPRLLLARHIAETVKGWIGVEHLPSRGRAVQPGDVMILVRRRNVFFEAMVRELKRAQVPVAGADRMRLAEQIVVQDLLALAQFCLLPHDDLTLAIVLKGPAFDFTEDDLFQLCHNRGSRRLWQNLRLRAAEQPHWQQAADELARLLGKADQITPFAFFAEWLGAGGGRQRLLSGLGTEAGEPIDEFLSACMAYERDQPASLQGFVSWFDQHAGDIKRDLEQGRNEVRVLTVHGAKGLEAPIVILPDTCDLPLNREDEGILWTEGSAPLMLWPPKRDADVELSAATRARRQDAALAEYRRLLYVALTRARDRLYICGYLNRITANKGPDLNSWHSLVQAGFERLPGLTRHPAPGHLPFGGSGAAEILRYESHGPAMAAAPAPKADVQPAPLPEWASRAAPAEAAAAAIISPSRAGHDMPSPQSPARGGHLQGLQRGRLIHRLLQSLPEMPPAEREQAITRFLSHPLYGLDPSARDEIAAEVLRLFEDPVLAEALGSGALAEAPVAGRVKGRLVSGRIDRLLVRAHDVVVLDFKTDRPPPVRWQDTPPAYLEQMALYCALVAQIFPERSLKAALLWTYAPSLMSLPVDELSNFTGS